MSMRVEDNQVTVCGDGTILPYEDATTAAEQAVFDHRTVMHALARGLLPETAPGQISLAAYIPFARTHAMERDLGGL